MEVTLLAAIHIKYVISCDHFSLINALNNFKQKFDICKIFVHAMHSIYVMANNRFDYAQLPYNNNL